MADTNPANDAYVTAVLTREQVQMLLDSIDFDTCFPENRPMVEDASERLHAALTEPFPPETGR